MIPVVVAGFAKKLWESPLARRILVVVVSAALTFAVLKVHGWWKYHQGYEAGKADVELRWKAAQKAQDKLDAERNERQAKELADAKVKWESQTRSLTDYVQLHPSLPDCRLDDAGHDLLLDLWTPGRVRRGGPATDPRAAGSGDRPH